MTLVPTRCSGVASGGTGGAVGGFWAGCGTAGHDAVDVVDHLAEFRVEAVPWVREVDHEFVGDAAGIGRNTRMRSHIEDGFLDVVGDHEDRLDRQLASIQRSMRSVRRVSAVSTSSALKGSSISSRSGSTTRARARPTRWRMPPESSFG